MKMPMRARNLPAFQPLALAVAAALACAALPASAVITATGNVGVYPIFSPLGPGNTDIGATNTLQVGNGAPGSFSVTAGSLFSGGWLRFADGGTGSATGLIDGAGTKVSITGDGTSNRFELGAWGQASMVVSGGATLDARANSGACLLSNQYCHTFIGNAAGSDATLTVTGAGSNASFLRQFVVGGLAVFHPPTDTFTFGTPGGTTTGRVNVLAGGTLTTDNANLGVAPGGSSPLGTERSFAEVVINGVGSTWRVTGGTVDGSGAFVGTANHANATANITIANGGQMWIDGKPGSNANGINLSNGGGQTAMTITGAGSSLLFTGDAGFLQVGRRLGSASLDVLNGGKVSGLYYMSVGRDGSVGSLAVNGAGSEVLINGTASAAANGTAQNAFLDIGRGGGQGTVNVTNGGKITLVGVDSRPGGVGMNLGREINSSGTLNIDGAGSVVSISQASAIPGGGPTEAFNPFVRVGRDGSGTLNVANGGKLLIDGRAVSTVADSRSTTLFIGGSGDTVNGGSGTALVSGLGSEIRLTGVDTYVGVGVGPLSSGNLTVRDHASLSTLGMEVGRSGGLGVFNVDSATASFSGQQTGNTLAGAFLVIGSGSGGTGAANLTNGAVVTLSNLGSAGAGIYLGGTTVRPAGNGTLTVSGGSQINVVAASGLANFRVGLDGTGVASFSQASSINIGDGRAEFGRLAGSSGALTLASGSSLAAGTIAIGGSSDTVAGGTGTAIVTGAGSSMSASGDSGFISVGRGGTGSLAVTNQATVSGIVMNIGRAAGGVGTLTVDNSTLNLSGQQATGTLNGAALSIGNRGGSGTASIGNGSVVNITNAGSNGVSLNIGGTPINPLGSGSLSVSNSTINLVAAPGQAVVRVGHDGSGSASLTASTLNTGDGFVIIAGQPGSTGTLTLSAGSVVNTGYVGVGSTPSASPGITQNPGGAGNLVLNNSTINTTTFEIGALGVLSGDGGVIHAAGDVIVGGTISPGNSPGRIVINCNIITLPGSHLILDVLAVGGGYNIDQLVIGNGSTFDLSKLQIVFNFLGNTDPTAFAASGGFDLDHFLRSGLATGDLDLSTAFATGQTWATVVDASQISAVSSAYDVTQLSLKADGSFDVTVAAIPEPSTWGLMFAGLLFVAVARVRARSRVVSQGQPVPAARSR